VHRSAPLLLLVFVLTGCAGNSLACSLGMGHDDCSPGMLGNQEQRDVEAKAAATEAANAGQDDATCRSYGLQPNTPPYAQCLTRLEDQRAAAESSDRSGVAGRLLGRSNPMSN
jgi:hypothetical protein